MDTPGLAVNVRDQNQPASFLDTRSGQRARQPPVPVSNATLGRHRRDRRHCRQGRHEPTGLFGLVINVKSTLLKIRIECREEIRVGPGNLLEKIISRVGSELRLVTVFSFQNAVRRSPDGIEQKGKSLL